jgi:hypothetical protein
VEIATTPRLYFSTGPAVYWSDTAWQGGGIEVSQLSATQAGLRAPNHDQAWEALILGNDLRDTAVRIWVYTGDAPGADDPAQVFEGVIDSADIGDICGISCVSDGAAVAYCPRLSLALWVGTDATPAGTRIVWDGQAITLEAQNG